MGIEDNRAVNINVPRLALFRNKKIKRSHFVTRVRKDEVASFKFPEDEFVLVVPPPSNTSGSAIVSARRGQEHTVLATRWLHKNDMSGSKTQVWKKG